MRAKVGTTLQIPAYFASQPLHESRYGRSPPKRRLPATLQVRTQIWHATHNRCLFRHGIKCDNAKGKGALQLVPLEYKGSIWPPKMTRRTNRQLRPLNDVLSRSMDQSAPLLGVGRRSIFSGQFSTTKEIATRGEPEGATRERPPLSYGLECLRHPTPTRWARHHSRPSA